MLSIKNKKVLESLKKAITESKKQFSEIPQNAFYSYLASNGVSKNDYGEIYSELASFYNSITSDTDIKSNKVDTKPMSKNAVVYSQDPKDRTPRKSVFGRITQI